MNWSFQLCLITLLFAAAITAQPSKRAIAANAPAAMKAGFAKIVITPEKNMWMSGYANRAKPSEGKVHDLYAKALVIQDSRGARVALVTTDLLGLPRSLTSEISEHANKSYGLKREQILFNSSHTHTGPVVKSSLAGAYDLDSAQSALIDDYTHRLKNNLLKVIGDAIKDLSPAKLSFGRSTAPFAMNRRQFNPNAVTIGVNPEGVVDREVPALRVESTDGKLRGVLFGYACHNTTLTGEFYEFSGDYAGFAREAIEREHPGATAMFVAGCGADINPYPRSKRDLAEQHGETLAKSVEQAMSGSMKPVSGAVKSVIGGVTLPFAGPPTKEEYQSRLNDKNIFNRRHAERMIARYERDGKVMTEYPYTIQILRIGDLTLIGLAGEVVTDYALRLKRELGGDVWVAGYSNDLCSYIPSARMYKEGGYEVIGSMIYYDLPGPYKPEIEEKIVGKVHELARRLGVKATKKD
ncbi:MAG: neutral/alkaline non-lysosomal ceramidase N-terminal domain-containing protein [Blastocatellia bacterium]